jgi:hypothetical protein
VVTLKVHLLSRKYNRSERPQSRRRSSDDVDEGPAPTDAPLTLHPSRVVAGAEESESGYFEDLAFFKGHVQAVVTASMADLTAFRGDSNTQAHVSGVPRDDGRAPR